MRSLILDTNVVIAALCGRNTATSRLLLSAVIDRKAELVLGDDLIAEYARKLHHPDVMARHPYSAPRPRALLDDLVTIARMLNIDGVVAPACPNPTDEFLWKMLAADPDVQLVTWERALLDTGAFPGRVLTPPSALGLLTGT